VLALELAATIRHDGHGSLLDTLATPEGVEAFLERTALEVEQVVGRSLQLSSPDVSPALVELRSVVRNLFGRAVAPTRVEVAAPLDPSTALRRLNRAADFLGTPQLSWAEDADLPTTSWSARSTDPVRLLTGAVARSAIDFLSGPDVVRLRACPAARCVRYFLQTDPRQTWCSPSCGNRERVNRHYRKQSEDPSSLGE
jgi:predicted RNA-binding Zn ribbon-like protein